MASQENKKKKTSFFTSLWFGLILLLIGSILLGSGISLRMKYGKSDWGTYSFEVPSYVCESPDGKICIIDAVKRVLIKEDDVALCLLDAKDFGYDPDLTSIYSAVFDDEGNLYVYLSVEEKKSYSTMYDVVAKVDTETLETSEVVRFDYTSEEERLHRNANLYRLIYKDKTLRFLKLENETTVCEYIYNLEDSGYTKSEEVDMGPAGIRTAVDAGDKGYAVCRYNGSMGYLKDWKYEEVCPAQMTYIYDFENEKNQIPAYMGYIDGEFYFVTGVYEQKLLRATENGYELVVDLYDVCEDLGEYYAEDDALSNCRIFNHQGKVGLVLDNMIVYDYQTGEVDPGYYFISVGYVLKAWYRHLSGPVGFLFFVAGIIITFGGFVKWRMSMLAKQLLVTIPAVVMAFAIVAGVFFLEFYYFTSSEMETRMISIAQMGAQQFDGDEVEQVKNFDSVDDGTLLRYHQMLRRMVEDNQKEWSSRINVKLMLYNYEDDIQATSYYELAESSYMEEPFISSYQCLGHVEAIEDPNIGYECMMSDSILKKYYICDAAIRNSQGKVVAVYEVSTDDDDFINLMIDLSSEVGFVMLFLLALIIVLICVLTYFNVRKLRKASETVAVIANGNFSQRIEKPGRDEVGDICRGVNDMAGKLDMLFKEKDENEQFYYKFVPEQFKDLLHKDKFTQLSLGDAESVDLTVLFCDIRSFSLNSEMMTAKENFEFINIIYGIAGPIIRKHNGFVDKYIGDALMALFENADDAIRCGEELYQKIALDDSTAKRLNISSINIGIGIHTGMARIGIVGEEERMSGTVISNTVNLSSRLETLTKQYDTAMIISKDTLDRISDPDSINTRYLGMIQVAGVNEVKALYEVLDCLDEKREKVRSANKATFKEAVRLYHLGDLEKSLKLFSNIAADIPNDPAIATYIDYIRTMIANGSKDSKVFRFDRK